MAANVYFVTALSDAPKVIERINSLVAPADRYDLADDKWFVAYDGPAQDLAEKSGVRAGDEVIGTGLVISVTTYSGRASPTLWDWLRAKGL